MAEEQFVTVTAYETELVNMITVPAHYSLSEIREAVWAKMNEHAGSEAPNRDHASIIIASSGGENKTNATIALESLTAVIYVKPDQG